MKNEIKVVSKIKFITVEFPIEVQSFKCTAEIQLVVGEDSELLEREFMDFRNAEFMGLPVDDFCTFRKKMRVEFGVNIMKLVEDQIDLILTDKVCKRIISENII
jgi:hypothetical protein